MAADNDFAGFGNDDEREHDHIHHHHTINDDNDHATLDDVETGRDETKTAGAQTAQTTIQTSQQQQLDECHPLNGYDMDKLMYLNCIYIKLHVTVWRQDCT